MALCDRATVDAAESQCRDGSIGEAARQRIAELHRTVLARGGTGQQKDEQQQANRAMESRHEADLAFTRMVPRMNPWPAPQT